MLLTHLPRFGPVTPCPDSYHAPRLVAWDISVDRPWLAVECALDGTPEPAPNLRAFMRQQGILHGASPLTVACQFVGGLHRAHRNGLGPAHSPGPAALPYVGGPGGPWPDPRGQGHLQAAAAPEDGLQGSPIDRKTRSRTRAHLKLHAAADEPWTRPLDMTLLCREARPDSLP